ncbi:hypothetical protein RSAG8_13366, partial [Rhizoctonia solani AG-8 WAC10335]
MFNRFLIESHKSLRKDNEDTIASNTILMVELLHAIATKQPPSTLNMTALSASNNDFHPTTSAVLINLAWFLSLALSITVSLLAMLVKQWGEGYRFGHGLTAPYTQARTRQARYDRLKAWGTEDIVLALPVMMHGALGLFLLGLILFLKGLSRIIFILIVIVVAFTALFYLATTLLPLRFAFCPFNTPLSSRRLWNYVSNKLIQYRIIPKDTKVTASRREEILVSQDTAPDSTTARALEWLISHSQDKGTADTVIEALSNATLDAETWKVLAQPSLVRLVIQRFTAIFLGVLDYDVDETELNDESQVKEASMYGQVLVNLVKCTSLPDQCIVDATGSTDCPLGPDNKVLTSDDAALKLKRKVERGLLLVSFNHFDQILAARGITNLSLWYTLTDRSRQTRKTWENMLVRLIEVVAPMCSYLGAPNEPIVFGSPQPLTGNDIHPGNEFSESLFGSALFSPKRTTTKPDNHQASGARGHSIDIEGERGHWKIPTSSATLWGYVNSSHVQAAPEIEELFMCLRTLTIEVSHWRWDIMNQGPLLQSLLELFGSNLLHGPARGELSATLAVFAMLFNNYPEIPPNEKLPSYATQEFQQIEAEVIKLHEAKRRPWRAQYTATITTQSPKYLQQHSDSLLLLGIGGLLDSFAVLGLADSALDVIKIFVTGLNKISTSTFSGPITLPYILPSSCVLRRCNILDVITRALNPSPFESHSDGLSEKSKAELLRCISRKRPWVDFGHQLILPILQLLHSSNEVSLQSLCLDGLNEYCEMHALHGGFMGTTETSPKPTNWQMLFAFDAPHKMLQLIKDSSDEDLKSKALSSFCSITSTLPAERVIGDPIIGGAGEPEGSRGLERQARATPDESDVLSYMIKMLKKITLSGLLDTRKPRSS